MPDSESSIGCRILIRKSCRFLESRCAYYPFEVETEFNDKWDRIIKMITDDLDSLKSILSVKTQYFWNEYIPDEVLQVVTSLRSSLNELSDSVLTPIIDRSSGANDEPIDQFKSRIITRLKSLFKDIRTYSVSLPGLLDEHTASDFKEICESKAIMSIDLSQYGKISKGLEDAFHGDPEISFRLNHSILNDFTDVIKSLNIFDTTLIVPTGDGAIILFDSVSNAFRFASEVHSIAAQTNGSRYYRIGITYRQVMYRKRHGEIVDIGGTGVSEAVRIEGMCETGSILAHQSAYDELTDTQKKLFDNVRYYVNGKIHEPLPIPVMYCDIQNKAPWDAWAKDTMLRKWPPQD